MQMTIPVRRFALTAHVSLSLGWMGAVACFLALAIIGFTSRQPFEVQAAYLGMEMICWSVIVPLSFLSPATGIAQALWTPWGLLKHYWVLVKLLVTLPCTAVLLLHMPPSQGTSPRGSAGSVAWPSPRPLRLSLRIYWAGGWARTICIEGVGSAGIQSGA